MRRHLVVNQGTFLVEDVTPEETAETMRKFYEDVGGAEFFRRLGTAFYKRVADDDVLAPLFPGPWDLHATRLAEHFISMYGKPDPSEAWDPHLTAAHTHFLISHDQRVRWLDLMRQAGTDIDAPEPVFSDFMAVMVLATSSMMAASRGAAIARRQRFDRYGKPIP
jgi:truncated hemoglobin YjbI